jgi:DNA-binding MarR family transcriptional regulator
VHDLSTANVLDVEASVPSQDNAAFLLAQIGAEAARKFAERVAALDLTPPQSGLLKLVACEPGLSQQAVASRLGTPPSRLVALVDGLAERGLLERRRNTADRRLSSLHLTDAGRALLDEIGAVALAHDDAVCGDLDQAERARLRELLLRVAAGNGLSPGVHPGYRRVSGGPPEGC